MQSRRGRPTRSQMVLSPSPYMIKATQGAARDHYCKSRSPTRFAEINNIALFPLSLSNICLGNISTPRHCAGDAGTSKGLGLLRTLQQCHLQDQRTDDYLWLFPQ